MPYICRNTSNNDKYKGAYKVKKIILGLILIVVVILAAFSFGQEEVLSGNIEPELIELRPEEGSEVTEPELPIITEPEKEKEKEVKEDLDYDEVLKLIDDENKKIIDNPNDLLVLVNKANNLPSSYKPEDLIIPNVSFTFEGDDQKKYMRKDAALALEELITKAEEDGHKIYAVSGYRSYERQKAIFLGNVQKSGFKKANTFSAVPGQSEHQTGLAMDVSSASVNYKLMNSFGNTPEGLWLKENAHLFGFIIRYPQTKVEITGYQYEPWHVRFVGIENATFIKMNNLTLEEFFVHKETL